MMKRKNFENIKANFTKQTGVEFPMSRRSIRKPAVIALAVVFTLLLATTAVAASGLGARFIAWFGIQPENTEYDYLGYIENYECLITACDSRIVHPLSPGTASSTRLLSGRAAGLCFA